MRISSDYFENRVSSNQVDSQTASNRLKFQRQRKIGSSFYEGESSKTYMIQKIDKQLRGLSQQNLNLENKGQTEEEKETEKTQQIFDPQFSQSDQTMK